jgi:hypothetical protein
VADEAAMIDEARTRIHEALGTMEAFKNPVTVRFHEGTGKLRGDGGLIVDPSKKKVVEDCLRALLEAKVAFFAD